MKSDLYSCPILMTPVFSKNTQISSFIKFRPVGAELFRADGRTDMTKLIDTFRNFANAPKMSSSLSGRHNDTGVRGEGSC